MSPSLSFFTSGSRRGIWVLGVVLALVTLGGCVGDLGYGGALGVRVEPNFGDRAPAWSPNGLEIAVSRSRPRELGSDIYLMDTLGVAVQVTEVTDLGSSFAWSPDGLRIAFTSVPNIYVVRPDGSELTEFSTNSPTFVGGLAWSPDGATIAFSTWETSGVSQMFLLDTATSSVTGLTQPASSNSDLSWSPDGSQAVFTSFTGGSTPSDIYRMEADGSVVTQLTYLNYGAGEPAWSPCGAQIVFSAYGPAGSGHVIYLMDSDGSNLRMLTDQAGFDWAPSWSPDCSQLVFSSDRGGDTDIWVIKTDGSGLRKLTRRD